MKRPLIVLAVTLASGMARAADEAPPEPTPDKQTIEDLNRKIDELRGDLSLLTNALEEGEENRLRRADGYSRAAELLAGAKGPLEAGSTSVGSDLDEAGALLEQATADARRYHVELEVRWAEDALESLALAREALGRGDLYDARVYLGLAVLSANSAWASVQSHAQPSTSP
jgi:hypothetical protein